MWVTLMDYETGEVKDIPNEDWSAFWWTEENGSCDCNRSSMFDEDIASAMEDAQAAEHSELKPWQAYCHGVHRFIVVDIHGDFEGESYDKLLARMNSDYPQEKVAFALKTYQVLRETCR